MNVVFDLGNVLLRWDPTVSLQAAISTTEEEMEWFLAHVCNNDWNLEQDRGRSFAEAVGAGLHGISRPRRGHFGL